MANISNFFLLILQVPIIIYQPKVMPKWVPTHSSILEHGAEAFYLDDEDVGKDEQDPNYFPIKLAYNKFHHYMPIVPENILNYLETYNNATYYTRQPREALKSFRNTLPHDSNYYKLVDYAYTAAINTTTVLSGCNIISGTTGTAGATSAQVWPAEQEEPLEEQEEDEDLQFRLPEKDDSPAITIPHKGELKHGPHQCFCGKGDLKKEADRQKHL